MQTINTVSETALLTLRSRVIESAKRDPLIEDPVGEVCFKTLLDILPAELQDRILKRKLSSFLSMHLALRARKYDELCMEFLDSHPQGLIVNLGCGFDTRFWRLGIGNDQYMELDLPEVMELKKGILGDKMTYRTIGGSVLEDKWIREVNAIKSERILFLAEGLFMYFPSDQAIKTLQAIAGSFGHSRLVLEVVHEKYTRGTYKRMVEKKMKRRAGSEAGEYFLFGIKRASDLESFHPDYRINEEWSFFQDPRIRPSFLKIFKNLRTVAKSQYTVIADIS